MPLLASTLSNGFLETSNFPKIAGDFLSGQHSRNVALTIMLFAYHVTVGSLARCLLPQCKDMQVYCRLTSEFKFSILNKS